jgi:hypothetical protein
MPKLRGTALLAAKQAGTSTKGGGRKATTFTPLFRLAVGESAYVQFLEDDLEEVFMHTFVRVPTTRKNNDRGYDFEHFVSRTRNEGYTDEHSVLEEELDHWPIKKIAGVAVLLEPEYNGKEEFKNLVGLTVAGNTVTRDDGTENFYPRWQLIFEAYGSFWENLIQISNTVGLTQFPILVTRVASDAYQFMAVSHVQVDIDWDKYADYIPKVEDEIKRLASEERYEEYFGEGKQRIKPQGQRHNFLPEWIQKERAEFLNIEVGDDDEVDPTTVDTSEEEPKPKAARKAKKDFSDLESLVDENQEVTAY